MTATTPATTTIIRPWHPGDGRPAGTEILRDEPERRRTREQLEDDIGDAIWCSDDDCSCKAVAREAREELEELLLDCARCPYSLEAHVDGECPDEATAVAVWGRS